MISIGIILLLVTLGRLPKREMFIIFAKYWPVLLILWGVAKLIDHMQAQKHGYRTPGMGAGGVFLLIMLTIFGLGASGAYHASSHVNWDEVSDEFQIADDDFVIFGQKYEFADQSVQPLPANGSVKVVLDRGAIKVTPSSDSQVHITANKVVYANDQGEAEKLKGAIAPTFNTDGNQLVIEFSRRGDWKGGRVDLEVAVPKNAALDLFTNRGDIDVRDREAYVKTHTSRGSTTLSNVIGNTENYLRRGDFVVKNVKGDVSVEGRVDDAQLSDITGAVTLNGDYMGGVQLSKIGKSVRFKSSRTDMEFAKLEGDFDMSSGDLRARNVTGPFRIDTRSKDIHLDEVSGDIRIEDEHADVELHPKQIGNIEVSNRSGGIRLVVPGNANLEVNARADRGEVDTDFNLNRSEDKRAQTLQGVINRGGPKVQLNTQHGTISVFKTEGTRAKEESPKDSEDGIDNLDAKIERKLEEKQRKVDEKVRQAEQKARDAERKANEAEREY
jgi:DUF4097 and DUF4098 domain-containing protein YvlB